MKKLLAILFVAAVVAGCMSEDDETRLLLMCGVSSDTVVSREKVRVDIFASVQDSRLARMKISTFDATRGEVLLKDSVLDAQSFEYAYFYEAPLLDNDSSSVELEVEMEDATGFSRSFTKKLMVVKKDYLLEELAGITMYQQEGDNRPNGFSLRRMLPVMTSLADSADIDIYACESNIGEALSREWRTNTDVYFVRANNFDYAKASSESVRKTYSSSVGYKSITGLDDDDIILVGRGNEAAGVIRIQFAVDNAEKSRYVFNLKAL